jgi:hypothetical protein
MKKNILFIVLLALAAGLVMAAGEKYPVEGVVSSVTGNVSATGAAGAKRSLKARDEVYAGDVIETAEQSVCKLSMGDGSELMVPARSRVQINDSRAQVRGYPSIAVYAGRIWASIVSDNGPSGFEVQTVTTVTGVRGTKLSPGTAADGASRILVIHGSVQTTLDSGPKTVNQGNFLQVGLDGTTSTGSGKDSDQEWQNFFNQGLARLRGNPQAILARMMEGMKGSRGQVEMERAGLRSALARYRALKNEIEGKTRIVMPEEDKKKLATEAASLLSRLRRTQVLLDRFRAFLELIRDALRDLLGNPGAYPGAAGDAVRRMAGEAEGQNPDQYERQVLDELAGMAAELEDDIMRFDFAPGLGRLPQRKKSDRLREQGQGGGPGGPNQPGPPTGHEGPQNLGPDAPPLELPTPQPEPEPHPEPHEGYETYP